MSRIFFAFSFFVLLISCVKESIAQSITHELSGIVTSNSGEALAGAVVLINPGNKAITVNERGRFTISLPQGDYRIECQYLGMEKFVQEITLNGDKHLTLKLQSRGNSLKQVEVIGRPSTDVNSTNMGSTYMDVKLLTKMPALLGEADVIRSVSSLPGVVNAGEGTGGFYVRGGSADQNLVLLDDVPVFNSSHLFGFFSVYNPDVLKSYTLHRSGISARYGSRISSILDVKMREGNEEKMQFQAGISPISAKFSFDGPINSKLTVLVAGRAATPTYLLKMFKSENIKKSSADFYDLNVKANLKLNEKNNLALSTYYSADGFKFPYDTTYNWTNTLGSLKWNHVFNQKLSSAVTVSKSIYDNNVEGLAVGEEFNMSSGIDFTQLKADLAYFSKSGHQVDFGAGASDYIIQPGKLQPYGTSSLTPKTLQKDKGTEYYAYLNDEITINDRLAISVGLRYSFFAKRGPYDVYLYKEGEPRSETSITDTIQYTGGDVVQSYNGLEPRVSAKYSLDDTRSIKASFSRTKQYIQLVSNTAAITPVDIWKLSNNYLKPQHADQVSLGYFYVQENNDYEFSWEVYYKLLENQLDYKDGANIILNPTLEADLLYGDGYAYGSEWLFKKNNGRLNGWFSLTYSRSYRTINGATTEETINKGETYPSDYDKPLNVNIFADYDLTPKWTFSANLTYTTGRPITASNSWYRYYGHIFANYSGRNQQRMPDYHRLDISFNYNFNEGKKVEYSGSFSVYNLYGRKNAYSTFFRHYYGSPPGAYKLAVIGAPIPSINLNIKF